MVRQGNSNGRKPPPPRKHADSGNTGTPGPVVTKIVILIWAPPVVAFLSSVGWLIKQYI